METVIIISTQEIAALQLQIQQHITQLLPTLLLQNHPDLVEIIPRERQNATLKTVLLITTKSKNIK